jgi:hypothetical protein
MKSILPMPRASLYRGRATIMYVGFTQFASGHIKGDVLMIYPHKMSSIVNGSDDVLYHRKIELSQRFRACHIYLSAIRKSLKVEELVPYLDAIDETLQWVLFQFSSISPPTVRSSSCSCSRRFTNLLDYKSKLKAWPCINTKVSTKRLQTHHR